MICTHSHFLVSDLKPENSTIISLVKNDTIIAESINKNTYGWSAEEVLYKVFDVRTTRNYYLESDMRELLYLISENHKDRNGLEEIISRVRRVRLSDDDPLNLVIEKAQNYIDTL